jgi:hypothetical protein
MPLPEGYLPRKGDIVLVQARVRYDADRCNADSDCSLEIVGSEHRHFFQPLAEVHALHCRKWNAGDRVKSAEFDGPGEVLATCDDQVWVMCETGEDEGGKYTLEANQLDPYVEPAPGDEWDAIDPVTIPPPCDGKVGSEIANVGDPIAARDEAANR